MFPFIDKTWNPLGGRCKHNCVGCWAMAYANRIKMDKYKGSPHIDTKQINKVFKPGTFVFVCDMTDLFASNVPMETITYIMQKIDYQSNSTFLLLTKNPRYMWLMKTPANTILGATIDTNRDYSELTLAPKPMERIKAMQDLAKEENNRRFVSVEPIKDFDLDIFAEELIKIKPWAIAVGYDNYNNHFPEPSLAKTQELIKRLRDAKIKVYEKTLREANH
jgi:protein gp37